MVVLCCKWCAQNFFRKANHVRHEKTCAFRGEKGNRNDAEEQNSIQRESADTSLNLQQVIIANENSYHSEPHFVSMDDDNDANQIQLNATMDQLDIHISIANDLEIEKEDNVGSDEDNDETGNALESLTLQEMFGNALESSEVTCRSIIRKKKAISTNQLYVSYEQFKAAMYILNSGASGKGLSYTETEDYLKSLHRLGSVRKKWSSCYAFWNDHSMRQAVILPKIGQWAEYKFKPSREDIPTQVAYVREIKGTIAHLVESSKHLKESDSSEIDWNQHLNFNSRHQFDKNGNRILTDWFSGDDIFYIEAAMALDGEPGTDGSQVTLLPFQLFIDKASVTRLNQSSMYPVVLYLICFSRYIRRKLAVNVAFVPIVSKYSVVGGRLSDAIVKVVRNSVLQATIRTLLHPLQRFTRFGVSFPDGVRRHVRPFLLSVVLDLPEAAVCSSRRFGVSTRFGCSRCFVGREDFSSVQLDCSLLATAFEMNKMYQSISLLPTVGEQDRSLMQLGLRKPKSVFWTDMNVIWILQLSRNVSRQRRKNTLFHFGL